MGFSLSARFFGDLMEKCPYSNARAHGYEPFNVPMPAAIAALPKTEQGYPVPFINFVSEKGIPDLRVTDAMKVLRAVQEKLCGICGQKLGYWVVFVGGSVSIENRAFSDPAMHEECVRYAIQVCPYLAIKGFRHTPHVKLATELDSPNSTFHANPLAPPAGSERPERMGMYFTRDFEIEIVGKANFIIKASPAKRVEWFDPIVK